MRAVVKAHLLFVSEFHCLQTVLPPVVPESVGVVYGHPGGPWAGSAGQAEHAAPGSGPPVTENLKVVVKSWTEGTESVSSVRFVPFETETILGSVLVLGLDVRSTGGH